MVFASVMLVTCVMMLACVMAFKPCWRLSGKALKHKAKKELNFKYTHQWSATPAVELSLIFGMMRTLKKCNMGWSY